MATLADWLRSLLRPRLAVFTTQVRSRETLATMVAIRLTTMKDQATRAALALCGVAIAGFGPLLWSQSVVTSITIGFVAVVAAARKLGTTTTMVDAPLARAAVRAALSEGRKHADQHWRIDGPGAVELGRELQRLANLWLPLAAAGSGGLDQARATMIANAASPRLRPYLGELSLAEHQMWLDLRASDQLAEEEPGHLAAYHQDGAEWPSLNAVESEPLWPTLKDRGQP